MGVLPRTKMTMDAEHPASYELTTSAHQDLLIALAVPMLLALLTLPFTLLRVILLGWNCSLARQKEWDGSDADSSEESVEERVSGKNSQLLDGDVWGVRHDALHHHPHGGRRRLRATHHS